MELKWATNFFIIRSVMHRHFRTLSILGLTAVWFVASAFFKNHSSVKSHSAAAAIQTAPRNLLIAPVLDIEKMPEFKRIIDAKPEDVSLDHLKMQYLLARVRRSPYTFIRNEENFTGPRAAMHLIWKYQRKSDHVHNISDFIEVIATGSSMSGEPYLVQLPDGTYYRLKEIMKNELELLNERLESTQPPAPPQSEIST